MAKLSALLSLLLLLLFPQTVFARAEIPNPSELFYVADFAHVLEQSTVDEIVRTNDSLYQRTGAQIVVATVDFLDGEDIENYITKMFNQWGIGSSEKNNGILLLLVIGEENYHIVQGRGVDVTSGELGDLLEEYLEPDFAIGQYDAGVQKTFRALVPLLDTGEGLEEQEEQEDGYEWMVLLFVLFVMLAFMSGGGKRRRLRRFGGGFSPRIPPVPPVWPGHRPPPGDFRPRPPRPPSPPPGIFSPRVPRPPRPPRPSRPSRPPSGFGGGGFRGGGFPRSGGGGSTRGGGAGRR